MVLNIQEVQKITSDILKKIDEISTQNSLKYYLVCGSVLGAIRHGGPIPWDEDADITVPLPEMKHFCDVLQDGLKGTKYRVVLPGDSTIEDNITTFPRVALIGVSPRNIHVDIFPQIGITDNKEEQEQFTKQLTEIKTKYRDKRIVYTKTGPLWKRIAKLLMRIKYINVNDKKQLELFNELCKKYPYESSVYVTNPCGKYGTKNIVPKAYFGTPKRVPYLDMMLPVPEKTEEYLKHYYKDYMKYPPQEEIDRMLEYKVILED